jgi:hypothetical protein
MNPSPSRRCPSPSPDPNTSTHAEHHAGTVELHHALGHQLAELDLTSTDVYGGIAVVNFSDLTWRMTLTRDFRAFEPTTSQEQLTDLTWIVGKDVTDISREGGMPTNDDYKNLRA